MNRFYTNCQYAEAKQTLFSRIIVGQTVVIKILHTDKWSEYELIIGKITENGKYRAL